jgi:O-antigen/teichoic acid export membrane protein
MSQKRKVLQGSASNILRLVLSMLVSLVLPPFMVHRLSPAEYSAWVLILQLSNYVYLVDFGLQTAIGKFVAEYDTAGDHEASHHLVSTSFSILTGAAILALAGVLVLSMKVPALFHQMPPALLPDVRLGVIALGFSAAFALPFNAFIATFTGLQRYMFPTLVAITSRVLSAAALIVVLLLHGSLLEMAVTYSCFNIAAAIAQFIGWRRYARERVAFTFFLYNRVVALRLAKYGSVISIWTVALLLISGLDTVIVGHYDYKNTGFYAIAGSVVNVMLTVVSSVFGPMLPAFSSMQAGITPARMGELCIKTTRYCTLLLCLLGLPLFFGSYPLLSLWVGHAYATRSAPYLEILIVGNCIRQLAFPYVIGVMATGKQHLATASAIAEALVNVVLSIYLVQKLGAIGVALGTLAGAIVSVGVHLTVSMSKTRATILIDRTQLILNGVMRPLLCLVPSIFLYPFWRQYSMLPANPAIFIAWLLLTVTIAWAISLTADERLQIRTNLTRLLYWRVERA